MTETTTTEQAAQTTGASQTTGSQTTTQATQAAAEKKAADEAAALEAKKISDEDALSKLDKPVLAGMIKELRGEAKNRRLNQRELEAKINDIVAQRKLDDQKQLETNQEWEKAYNKIKDDTVDFANLKEFKDNYEKECQVEIDAITPTLTKAELEIFEISNKKMTVTEQGLFIKKLIDNRSTPAVIDNTQSIGRGGQTIVKDEGKLPFGNTSSVMGKVLEGLKTLREKIK